MAERRLNGIPSIISVTGPRTPSAQSRITPRVGPRLAAPRPRGGGSTVEFKRVSGETDDGFSIGDIGRSIGSAAGYVGSVIKGLPVLAGKVGQTGLGLAEFAVDTVLDVPSLFGAPEFFKSRYEQDWEKAKDLGLSGWDQWKYASQRQYPIFAPMAEGIQRTGGNIAEMSTYGLVDVGEPGINYFNALKQGNLGAVLLEDIGNVVLVGRAGGAGSLTTKAGGALAAAGKPRIGATVTAVGRLADEPLSATARGVAGLAGRGATQVGLGKTGAALGRVATAVQGEAPTISAAFRAGARGTELPTAGPGVGPLRQAYQEVVGARTVAALEEFDNLQRQINEKTDQRDLLAVDDSRRQQIDEQITELKYKQKGEINKTRLPKAARELIFEMQQRGEQIRTTLQTEIARISRDGYVLEAPQAIRERATRLREQARAIEDPEEVQRLTDLADMADRQASVKEANPGVLDTKPPSWVSPATVILLTRRANVVLEELNNGRSFQDVADLLTPIEVGPDLQLKGYRFTAADVEAVYRYATGQLDEAQRLMIDMTSVLYQAWYKLFNTARLKGVGGSEPLPFTYMQDTPDPKFLVEKLGDSKDAAAIYNLLDTATISFLATTFPELLTDLKVSTRKFKGIFKKLAAREYTDPLFKLANAILGLLYDDLLQQFPQVFRNEMIYPAPMRPSIIAQNRVLQEVRGQSLTTLLREINDVIELAGDLIGKRTVDSIRKKQQELPNSAAKYSKRHWTTLRQQIVEMRARLTDPELRNSIERGVQAAEANALLRQSRLIEAEQRLGAMEATLRQIEADPEAFLGPLAAPAAPLVPAVELPGKPFNNDVDRQFGPLFQAVSTHGSWINIFKKSLETGESPNGKKLEPEEIPELESRLAEQQALLEQAQADLTAALREYYGPDVPQGLDAKLIADWLEARYQVDRYRWVVEENSKILENWQQEAPKSRYAQDAKNALEQSKKTLSKAEDEFKRLSAAVDEARGISARPKGVAEIPSPAPRLSPVDTTNAERISQLESEIAEATARIDEQRALLEREPTPEPAAETPAPKPSVAESPMAMSARMDEESRLRGNLGLSTSRLTNYEVISAETPTPAQVTKLASGMQAGRTFVEMVGPDGQTWLIDHPSPVMIYTTENSARAIKLKTPPFDGPYPGTGSANTLLNRANEQIAAASPTQLDANTAKPIAQIKYNVRKSTTSNKLDTTDDYVVLDVNGRLVFVNGRMWAGLSKAHPNARFVQLEDGKALIALDGTKVVGLLMPVRIQVDAGIDVPTPEAFLSTVRGELTPKLAAPKPATTLAAPKIDRAAIERKIADAETQIAKANAELDDLRRASAEPEAEAPLTAAETAIAEAVGEIRETYLGGVDVPQRTPAQLTSELRARLKGIARVSQANLPKGRKAPTPGIELLKTPRLRAERAIATAEKRDAKAQEQLRNLREKHAALDEAPEMITDALLAAETPIERQMAQPFGPQAEAPGETTIYLPGGTTALSRGGRNLPTELRAEGMPGQTLASYERLRETDLMPLSMTEVGQRMSEVLSAMNRNETVQQIVMDPKFASNAASLLGAEKLADLEREATRKVTEQSRIAQGELGLVRDPEAIKQAIRKEYGRMLYREIDRLGYEPVSPVKVNPDGTSEPLGDLLSQVNPEDVDPLTYLMRKGMVQQITQQFVVKDTGNIPPGLKRRFEQIGRLTSGWKSMILPFSLRWQIGDAVSNVLMAWVRGDIKPSELAQSFKDVYARLRAQETSFFESVQSSIADPVLSTLIGAGLQARGLRLGDIAALRAGVPTASIDTFGLRGPFQGFREKMFRLNELHNTVARLSVAMKKLGDVLDEQGRSIDEVNTATYLSDPVIRDAINQAVKETNNALGAFSELSPWEKNVVRQAWPFWSWLKFINKAAAQMVLDDPDRVLFMANLGALALEDDESGFFDFLQGTVPVQGMLFDLSFLNPYQDAVLFQPNVIKALQDQIGSLSPVIVTPAKAAQIVAYYATGDQQIPLGNMSRPGYLEGRPGATSRTFGDMLGELGYLGLTSFGGPARNVLRAIPFQEIPIIAPEGRLIGTDVAIGNRQVYPQGSARTTGAYAQPRLGPVAAPVRAMLSTFGVPAPIAEIGRIAPQASLQRQREAAARSRRDRERERSRLG